MSKLCRKGLHDIDADGNAYFSFKNGVQIRKCKPCTIARKKLSDEARKLAIQQFREKRGVANASGG